MTPSQLQVGLGLGPVPLPMVQLLDKLLPVPVIRLLATMHYRSDH